MTLAMRIERRILSHVRLVDDRVMELYSAVIYIWLVAVLYSAGMSMTRYEYYYSFSLQIQDGNRLG